MRWLLKSLIVAFLLLAVDNAGAQRTVKIIVPYPAGGPTDVMSRLLADYIGQRSGMTIIIENRAGAGSVIGTEAAARAVPDGNTLLISSLAFVINPLLRKLNYDPLTSFDPVCQIVRSPQVIAVNNSSPHHKLNDLLAAAREKPGELTMASVGPGTRQHIAYEQLRHEAKVTMNYVPYAGDAPVVNALLGGHVSAAFINYAAVAEHIRTGKLRALATASKARLEPLPDVPTIAETGPQDFEAEGGFGIVAPATSPKSSIDEFSKHLVEALRTPEIASRLIALGLYPVGTCGADFATYLRREHDEYARIIRQANIGAQ